MRTVLALYFLSMFCLSNASAQKNKANDLETLDSLYEKHFNTNDFTKALELAKQRMEILKEKDTVYLWRQNLLALSYQRRQEFEAAEKNFKDALELSKKLKIADSKTYIRILSNLGVLYTETARYKEAETALLEVEKLNAKHSNDKDKEAAGTFNNLAMLYFYSGRYEAAEQYYKKYSAFYLKLTGPESPEYATAINNTGVLYLKTGRYEEAIPLFQKALEIRKKNNAEKTQYFANNLNNLAISYWYLGQHEQAEPLFIQASEHIKNLMGKDHPAYGSNLHNLAMFYSEDEQHKKAEPYYIESIDIIKRTMGEKHPYYATALNNYGQSAYLQGDYAKAEKLYLKASETRKTLLGEEHPDYAMSLFTMGTNYTAWKKYDRAEDYLKRAQFIFEKIEQTYHPDYLSILRSLGELWLEQKNFDKAYEFLSLSILRNCRDNPSEKALMLHPHKFNYYSNEQLLKSLKALCTYHQQLFEKNQDTKALQQAYLLQKSGMEIYTRIRNSFGGEKDKLRALADQTGMLDDLFETASKTGLENNAAELFKYAEFNKSILLSDATKAERARNLSDLPDSLTQKESKLSQQLDELEKMVLLEKDNDKKSKLKADINLLNVEIDAFKKQIEKNYPRYYTLKYDSKSIGAADVQQKLDSKTLFLEFFVADSALYLFSLTDKGMKLNKMGISKDELKQRIGNFRKSLSDYAFIKEGKEAFNLYTDNAFWFYKNLLSATLSENKNCDRLIIVTDDELGHLPFEAMLTEAVNNPKPYTLMPFLLNRYAVSYNYSAALWLENSDSKNRKKSGKILAMAATYEKKEEATAQNRSALQRNLRDALSDLPEAKKEVEQLSALFSGSFLTGDAANEGFFKKHAAEFGIIHLAMHGLYNQRAPILSSLAFTENGDSTEDNFLEAWEISHLKLNAQLVVLSACETGYGKFQQGEGVMSLGRSFMYAGVPSLLVSLWEVNDESTGKLMLLFYENLSKGMRKDEALRLAKLSYIKSCSNPAAAHPAFWSAFVIMGNTDPVKISAKSGYLWIGIAGMTLLLVSIYLYVIRRKKKLQSQF